MPSSTDGLAQRDGESSSSRQHTETTAAPGGVGFDLNDVSSWMFVTLEMAGVGLWCWDIERDKIIWTEPIYRIHALTPETFGGNLKALQAATFPDDLVRLGACIEDTLSTGRPYAIDYRVVRPDGSIRWMSVKGQAALDENRKPYRLAGTAIDVTERKREEAEHLAMQQAIIDAQRQTLRELGAPIIPLADQTLAVPLVGQLTRERADQVSEALLNEVRDRSAQTVLLDVTGVPIVDTSVAQSLVRAAQAVRLLGAEVVLTGIRPQVAQTLVELGVELQTFIIRANLQSGIEYAAALRKQRASSPTR